MAEGLEDVTKIYNGRKEKIRKLVADLRQEKLLYVRSPRGSAKSSLRYLLEKQVCSEENGFAKVYSVKATEFDSITSYNQLFQEYLGEPNVNTFAKKYRGEKPVLVIVDDFQELFGVDEMPKDLKNFVDLQMCVCYCWQHGERTLGRDLSTSITFFSNQQRDISFLLEKMFM